MKIITLEFPSNSAVEHEFNEGALIADLLSKLGNTAIVKRANIELTAETPLVDNMRLAVSRKDANTGVQQVKKIAGANDVKKLWQTAVLNDKTNLSFEDWLKEANGETANSVTTEGVVSYHIEVVEKQVEEEGDYKAFEGTTVLEAIKNLGYTFASSIEVNGKVESHGYVIQDGDRITVSQ